jgi:hypothetical protein
MVIEVPQNSPILQGCSGICWAQGSDWASVSSWRRTRGDALPTLWITRTWLGFLLLGIVDKHW